MDRRLSHLVRDAIPDLPGRGGSIFQCFRPAGLVAVIPAVECRAQDAELFQRPARRKMGLFDQADDFQFLRSRISHSSPSPSAIMLFLSNRNSRACSPTPSFNALASCRRSLTSLLVAARAVSPATLRFPASTNSFDQLYY